MLKQTSPVLLASLSIALLLAGCASVQTEAPIDEATSARVTTATPTAPATAPVTTTTPVTTMAPTVPSTTGRTETAAAITAPVTPTVVETRPLPQQSLPPAAPTSADTTTPASPKATASDLTTPGAHKDPASPLAQRVIYFEFDSAVIDSRFQPVLDAHATYLKANPGFKVILQGHADERGSREYNLALGQRRAESVRQALSLLGVPDGQMEAVSFGEEKPAVQGSNEEAWRMNRRTEIHYVDE